MGFCVSMKSKKKGLSSSDLIKGKIIKIVITDLDINTSGSVISFV